MIPLRFHMSILLSSQPHRWTFMVRLACRSALRSQRAQARHTPRACLQRLASSRVGSRTSSTGRCRLSCYTPCWISRRRARRASDSSNTSALPSLSRSGAGTVCYSADSTTSTTDPLWFRRPSASGSSSLRALRRLRNSLVSTAPHAWVARCHSLARGAGLTASTRGTRLRSGSHLRKDPWARSRTCAPGSGTSGGLKTSRHLPRLWRRVSSSLWSERSGEQ